VYLTKYQTDVAIDPSVTSLPTLYNIKRQYWFLPSVEQIYNKYIDYRCAARSSVGISSTYKGSKLSYTQVLHNDEKLPATNAAGNLLVICAYCMRLLPVIRVA